MLIPVTLKERITIEAKSGLKSISTLSREYKISRKTIYSWLKRKSLKPRYVKGEKHPKALYPKAYACINKLVVKYPRWGCRLLSKALLEKGFHLSYVQVNKLLNNIGAESYERRLNYARNFSGPGRVKEDVRIEVVSKALGGESISQLSKDYKLARKTIYKWIDRYQSIGNIKDMYVSGRQHPRAVDSSVDHAVLGIVAKNPEYSIRKLKSFVNVSSYTVWNILKKNNLNNYSLRFLYSQSRASVSKKAISTSFFGKIKSFFESFTLNELPAPPPSSNNYFKTFLSATFLSSIFFLAIIFILNNPPGIVLASAALLFGCFFFIYSLKYFISLAFVLSDTGSQLKSDFDTLGLLKSPFVSVHIAIYNERKVVERAIRAATSLKYKGNFEIVLCDDSTDETSGIITNYQKNCLFKNESLHVTKGEGYTLTSVEVRPGVILKHLKRTSRDGFKGAALKLALKIMDPRTEYISIFDADFVPYPDTLELFLKYFSTSAKATADRQVDNVAAVQGYQWHVLNKSENWITRGVRSEYAGSYVVERSGAEIYGGLKQISGSVYMIKRQALESVGWGTSITEDFELTLKLYEKGYKVLYTPYIQAPAECVSTLKRLIRQRMRWAEGHSFNVKKMFWKLLSSPKLTKAEKLEFVYLTPYYLQAFFFLVGTFSWLLSEVVFKTKLPFWTETWGWSLVLTNMISLPLLNAVGLFMEESEKKDYLGIISFVLLSYLVVPFQAYAAIKGFLEKKEGPWFRTPKTGRITDQFTRNKLYKVEIETQYLNIKTANSKFNKFDINFSGFKWVGKTILASLASILILMSSLSRFVPTLPIAYEAKAYDEQIYDTNTNWTKKFIYDHPEYAQMPIVKKDEKSVHFLKPDGQVEAQFLGTPINYKDGDIWRDIDTKIIPSNKLSYDYMNITNVSKTYFKETMKGHESNVLIEKDNSSISFNTISNLTIEHKRYPVNKKGHLSENRFVYPEVFKLGDQKIDIAYEVRENKIKEEIILNSYIPDPLVSQELNLVNSRAEVEGNNVNFYSVDTNKFLWFITPKMYELNNEEEANFGIHFEINCKDPTIEINDCRNLILTKVIDVEGSEWLRDPARNYPVVIDPDYVDLTVDGQLNGSSGNEYDMVHSNSGSYDTSSQYFSVGQLLTSFRGVSNYYIMRGILKFDTGSIPAGSSLTQVNLKATVYTDQSTTDFDIKVVKHDWASQDPISASNKEAAYDGVLTSSLDDNIFRNSNGISVQSQYTSGNLNTSWPNIGTGAYTYYSLVSGKDYTGTFPTNSEYVGLYSQESTTTAYRPVLTITYTEGGIPEKLNYLYVFGILIPFIFKRKKEGVQ